MALREQMDVENDVVGVCEAGTSRSCTEQRGGRRGALRPYVILSTRFRLGCVIEL